jgi:hypothetical protein
MKKILTLSLLIAVCSYADDMYGTVDNPQINGSAVDIHKPYIEPNQGYQPASTTASEPVDQHKVIVKQGTVKVPVGFKSDNWATDSTVEKVLKKAASDGKLGYVLEQAHKSNLPASVAIVPIVESHYNENAVSSKGAGGAWQLMPATANDYGLSSGNRFDFNLSTQTAIQLLNNLHKEFGDWALAFAAYNCGETCVKNALKKNPNATNIDDLSLPQETKDYVHKIVQFNQVIAGLNNKN